MITHSNFFLHPLLTIAIPTYNRPVEIQKQVKLLLPQLNDGVVLIIYDNFSDVPIETYFSEKELAKFKVVRNKVNVGADANIARCFESCETQWLWTLSDDDFVRKDAVAVVLDHLLKKSSMVFLNFCKGLAFTTIGFDELVIKFRSATVFSSSFTMSSCLYNMDMLRFSLIDYYGNLSSMVGTIILVLKYVQRNKYSTCEFIDESLIENYNKEVGWDYRLFILRSRLFIEAFDSKSNRNFHNTLFLGCHLTNYWLIDNNRNQQLVTLRERRQLFLKSIFNQGIFNALNKCPSVVIRLMLKLFFGINISRFKTFRKDENYAA